MSILKREEPTATVGDSQATTTTTTTATSRTYTLPKIFTPLPSSSQTTSTTEDAASYGITLFSAHPTSTTTTHLDPKVTYLPPSFAPLATTTTKATSSLPIETSTTTTTTTKSVTEAPSGLSGGQIAGIVIGSVLGGILVVYILYVLCWNRRRRRRPAHQVESPSSTMEEKGRQQLYHVEDFDHELMNDDDNNYVPYTDDDQPIGLPRTQMHYDPQRVYSTTCIPNDPKEDFISYYRAKPITESSSSESSESSLQRPYYGGFNPYYGPYMQPPPVIHGLGINTTASMHGTVSNPAVVYPRFTDSPSPIHNRNPV